ncbi:hypothetical protein PVAND_001624 [Polypedilum vanderplanki]|uniref:Uncharacterized protein n=1 Tax=Polypedilum vanderplanki TaxID=319348 RepID=A0A9J6BNI5_POLVA|nr:hypothetical protein PVAND_001624 [Polypedilum vanderplanki]
MDIQVQIFLIIGIVSIFLLALIIASSILAFFLIKLYNKFSRVEEENSYQRKHGNTFRNPTMDLDDELSRRYTMHTLERTDLETFRNDDDKRKANKETTKTHNVVAKNSHGGSAIDVSEQFIMKRQNANENSRYNSSIILQVEDRRGITNSSVHELRTPFNNDTF